MSMSLPALAKEKTNMIYMAEKLFSTLEVKLTPYKNERLYKFQQPSRSDVKYVSCFQEVYSTCPLCCLREVEKFTDKT